MAEGDTYSGSVDEASDDDFGVELLDELDEVVGEDADDGVGPKSVEGNIPNGLLRRSGTRSSFPGLYLMSEVHWDISFMAFRALGSWIWSSGVFQLPMIGL